jgi:hypothetical protein
MPPGARSGLTLTEWAQWAWQGGYKGTGHLMRSGFQPINYQCPESCRTSTNLGLGSGVFDCQDFRLMGWGSGHPGGAVLVFADCSGRFITDSIAPLTLTAMSTRDKAEAIVGE